jgi:sugar phosphate isomerase/epimerase
MKTAAMLPIGCNTLYPHGILGEERTFGTTAICLALDHIAALGYDAIEYSHVAQLSLEDAAAIRKHAESLGLRPWSAHSTGGVGIATSEQQEETLRRVGRCLDITAELGAQVLVYHAGPKPIWIVGAGDESHSPGQEARVIDGMCDHAARRGMELAIENGAPLIHMEYLLELLDIIEAPNLGICVDTGHAARGDLGAARAVRMAGEKLYTTHLQDNFGERDDHLPPGMGAIDWDEVADALAEVRYERVLQLELTDRPPPQREYDRDREMEFGIKKAREIAARIERRRQSQ